MTMDDNRRGSLTPAERVVARLNGPVLPGWRATLVAQRPRGKRRKCAPVGSSQPGEHPQLQSQYGDGSIHRLRSYPAGAPMAPQRRLASATLTGV